MIFQKLFVLDCLKKKKLENFGNFFGKVIHRHPPPPGKNCPYAYGLNDWTKLSFTIPQVPLAPNELLVVLGETAIMFCA